MMTTLLTFPMVRQRCSLGKGSSRLAANGSSNTNLATSKLIPCLRRFSSFLSSSHSHRSGRSFMAATSVILWRQRLTYRHLCLGGVNAGILQVLIVQFYHNAVYVDLAGYDVGDEAGAVLLDEADLADCTLLDAFNIRQRLA